MSTESEIREKLQEVKRKQINRLLDLWMHQNELLWGRLQTIAVIQAGVIGGWYYLTFSEHGVVAPCLGFCLTILGCILSLQARELIDCDLNHRRDYGDRIKDLDKHIFTDDSKKPQVSGWQRIKFIARLFVWINYILLLISSGKILFHVLIWLFHTFGC